MLDALQELQRLKKELIALVRPYDPDRVDSLGDLKFTPIEPSTPEENEEQFAKALWNLVIQLEFRFDKWKNARAKDFFMRKAPETIAPLLKNTFTPSLDVDWTPELYSFCIAYRKLLAPLAKSSGAFLNDLISGLGIPLTSVQFRAQVTNILNNLDTGLKKYRTMNPDDFTENDLTNASSPMHIQQPKNIPENKTENLLEKYFSSDSGLFNAYKAERADRYYEKDMIEHIVGFFSQHYVPDYKKRDNYISSLQEAYQLYLSSDQENKDHALRFLNSVITQGYGFSSRQEGGLRPLLMQFQSEVNKQARTTSQQEPKVEPPSPGK